jgi:outer membrane protein assembly factor BamC
MVRTFLVILLLVTLFSGCGMVSRLDEVLPDKRTEYKKSKNLPDLEIPPDLTSDAIHDRIAIPQTGGETATYSTFQERAAARKRGEELQRAQASAIKLLENEHVLAVQGVPAQIWPLLQRFWAGMGYQLELDDEELGVIETSWVENEENLIRDKFKVFAEEGQEPGTTILYISHRGEELVPDGDQLVWQARARDVELERRLVERLEEQMTGGGTSRVASAAPAAESDYSAESSDYPAAEPAADAPLRSELISAGGGKVYLTVRQNFSSAWKTTGTALSRAGVEVEQVDEARGVYYIRVPTGGRDEEGSGVWSKLKFWGKDQGQFQLSLTGVGDKTEVVVLDREGKWETSEMAGELLTRLNDVLNSGTL